MALKASNSLTDEKAAVSTVINLDGNTDVFGLVG